MFRLLCLALGLAWLPTMVTVTVQAQCPTPAGPSSSFPTLPTLPDVSNPVTPGCAEPPLADAPLSKTKVPELCPLESFVDWVFTNNHPVTMGDPDLDPELWQRTWGYAGFYGYYDGEKVAPNGIEYEPFFALDLLFNIGLTTDRSLYLTFTTRFWTQKPGDGITNSSQGSLDFSKRQLDLDMGVAWNYFGRFEVRGIAYSGLNINRGKSLVSPYGFKDGVYLENRYYLPSTNFDQGLYRFFTFGYYFSKDLVDGDGLKFKPGPFFGGDFALDICPDYFYTYVNTRLIFDKENTAKLFLLDGGLAFRPFESCRDLEFRVGADMNSDIEAGETRALFYGNVRLVW